MRHSTSRNEREMAWIRSATQLRGAADAPLAALRLVGGVEPVLHSTCTWAPGGTRGAAGNIQALDLSGNALRFGLGAAAFGTPPERAIRRLGEYLLIEGVSWWTPAAAPTVSRREYASTLLTPFLLQWDHVGSAAATLRSPSPVPLARWYEHLIRRLAELGMASTGVMAVEITADVPARLIADKHLVRAPLLERRPRDGQLITQEQHVDEFFLRNAVARARGDEAWCTAVMVGIAADPALTGAAAWGDEFSRRSFYGRSGAGCVSAVMHHTHALVTARLPAPERGKDEPATPAARVGVATTERAGGACPVQVVHIEDDTLLLDADARIGVVGAVAMD